ncbi:hypothetical protein AMATHDRAFT_333 [Amanita thiersii Skay4041]|uniref:Seipin n=1 Tax=Amanita thiersii Skay4041 TaxID=703135 RepID=A0A2A9P1R3_9AGAR|nr:hypothetical protein AMATHDRAFT_333 [Amanita thiersii Skay4041]
MDDEGCMNVLQSFDDSNEHSNSSLHSPHSSNILLSIISSYTPKIIPLLVFVLLIPILAFISILAGWLVWRTASTSWDAPVYLQYGDGSQPYAQFPLPTLSPLQHYDISLNIIVPATESNLALGNFMASLTLTTPTNKTLVHLRRPAIILSPSAQLLSRKPKTINIEIPLLYDFLPGTAKIIAMIELGRRDSWTSLGHGEGRELSVITAHVRGMVVHHGVRLFPIPISWLDVSYPLLLIRGLVSRFPLTSAIISAAGFLTMISLILCACILPSVLHRSSLVDTIDVSPGLLHFKQEYSAPSDSSILEDEGPSFRQGKRKVRAGKASVGRPWIKVEEETPAGPSTHVPADALRRRSFIRVEELSEANI